MRDACNACDGKGSVPRRIEFGSFTMRSGGFRECYMCHGTGKNLALLRQRNDHCTGRAAISKATGEDA